MFSYICVLITTKHKSYEKISISNFLFCMFIRDFRTIIRLCTSNGNKFHL